MSTQPNVVVEPPAIEPVVVPDSQQSIQQLLEGLDKEKILSLSGADLKRLMGDPTTLFLMNKILAESVTGEAAAEEQARLAAEETERAEAAAREAAEARAVADAEAAKQAEVEQTRQAEAARVAAVAEAEKERLAEEAKKRVAASKKIVMEFQATDEHDRPIGRLTHLEANTEEEMREKMKQAYIQAVRGFERLKRQKLQAQHREEAPAESTYTLTEEEATAAKTDLTSTDKAVAEAARQKLALADFAKRSAAADQAQEEARQFAVTYKFMRDHISDFYPCAANKELIIKYFEDNNLIYNEDNLEVAFAELESQLAPIPSKVSTDQPEEVVPPTVAANPPAAAVVPVTAPPVAAVPVASAPPAPAANPPVQDTRRGVNTGLRPGDSVSGVRPVTKQVPTLTKAMIKAWTKDQMKAEMRKPGRIAEINKVLAS